MALLTVPAVPVNDVNLNSLLSEKIPTFTIKKVRTFQELENVYRTRYQVYCLERGFESCEDHANGMESDEYDSHSIHFLALDNQEKSVGTVRLIMESALDFPMGKHCQTTPTAIAGIPKNKIAEISRLV